MRCSKICLCSSRSRSGGDHVELTGIRRSCRSFAMAAIVHTLADLPRNLLHTRYLLYSSSTKTSAVRTTETHHVWPLRWLMKSSDWYCSMVFDHIWPKDTESASWGIALVALHTTGSSYVLRSNKCSFDSGHMYIRVHNTYEWSWYIRLHAIILQQNPDFLFWVSPVEVSLQYEPLSCVKGTLPYRNQSPLVPSSGDDDVLDDVF